jgi:hypothetical protein
MAKIKELKKYVYNGVEFNSLEAIKEEIHNIIGYEVLDKINRVAPPQKHKDFIKILEVLCQPDVRKVLLDCLNVTFEEYDDYEELHTTINVLDLK